jgi:plasmid stabilization system protein ParE
MRRIEWSEPAQQELREIRSYIARDSVANARRFVRTVRDAVGGTQLFPDAAARVSEWDFKNIREVFVGQYRVIYEFDTDVIHVLTVIHGARQLPDLDDIG